MCLGFRALGIWCFGFSIYFFGFLARSFRTWLSQGYEVVKIRVPFWVLNIIGHLLFRAPKKGPENLTTLNPISLVEPL